MRLTTHTDYALRILLHAALVARDRPDHLLSIAEVAQEQAIARNHAMKVVNQLGNAGLLETVRGRSGGFRLGRPARDIRLGDVVRLTEPCMEPADCGACVMQGACGLSGLLRRAVIAFVAELDNHTLADAAATSLLPLGGRETPFPGTALAPSVLS